MNTVNKSTGFSPFQLHTSQSPRIIPSVTQSGSSSPVAVDVQELIERINSDIAEAKDNLMLDKIFQADQANRKRGPEDVYKVDDLVMLSMDNRRKDYTMAGSGRSAKLFPRRDGPYHIVKAFPQTSTCRLEIPNAPSNFSHTGGKGKITQQVHWEFIEGSETNHLPFPQ